MVPLFSFPFLFLASLFATWEAARLIDESCWSIDCYIGHEQIHISGSFYYCISLVDLFTIADKSSFIGTPAFIRLIFVQAMSVSQ